MAKYKDFGKGTFKPEVITNGRSVDVAKGKDAYDIPKNQIVLKPGMNSLEPGRVKTNPSGQPYVLRQTPKTKAKKAR